MTVPQFTHCRTARTVGRLQGHWGVHTTMRLEPQFEFTQQRGSHLYTAYAQYTVKQSTAGPCCNQRIATSCRLLSASLSAYVSAARA